MTIPEQAVQAAKDVLYYANPIDVERALTAAAPHLAAVRVKKLEWANSDEKNNDEWLCETDATPAYSIMRWWLGDTRDEVGHFEVEGLGEDQFGTLDEAKSAAQADYEARVLSALEPSAGRAAVLEEAARWHESEAEGYKAEIGGADVTGLLLAKEHRISATALRALASHPVADKPSDDGAQGEGWSMSPPKFHRYPYFVENISGKWCLCKHHGNGASHTISMHETAREARDAAPAIPTPPSGEVA